MKRNPYLIASIILFAMIVTTYASEKIFDDLKNAVIAGLVVGVLSSLLEVRLAIQTSSEIYSTSTQQAVDRLVTLLKFHNDYFNDQWLLDILEEIVNVHRLASQRSNDLNRFKRTMREALDQAKRETGQAYRLETGDNELERNLRLKESLDDAREYVNAVTFDVRDYLDRFWDKLFGEEYIKANLRAAKRNVKVKRIFVMSKTDIDDITSQKRGQLIAIAKSLLRAGSNMELYVALIEDLPSDLRKFDTSFLVTDDYVGSESAVVVTDKIERPGYVTYGDKEGVIEPLNARFRSLLLQSRPAKEVLLRNRRK